ncbi:SMI1/KNR4 family protein [Fusobacterium nucleatum]|uniref:SMI1 / KNR4 family protein n=1 Tax=Fusobacterium nucleatum subsp. polymorphum TaxID=76857 RepID=A0A2C6AYY1_FUSNP|nr:SMI1/KNR4 family protein [Fusobacterium polymorphum]PHH96831.1 SMI1 / KNR4 family protein [Fusobacterium polymorphum]
MDIAKKYIEELKKAYYENGGKEVWDNFEKIKEGATEENIKRLKEEFLEVPDSLIELLKIVDGTYHREYQGQRIAFYLLGSDVMGYPYYLLSSSQILENKKDGYCLFGGYIDGEYEDVEVDEKITDNSEKIKWLHFSNCMNNGGTSKLFIDFSPSEKGKKGQIVRYLHDPDEIAVIADSFDEYLEKLMEYGLDFISEDTIY